MIQMLTYSGKEEKYKGKNIIINRIHDAQALDDFEINIINLKDAYIWVNSGSNKEDVDCAKDLRSLSTMIGKSKHTKIVMLLPMNIEYKYNFLSYDGKYKYKEELKNMLDKMTKNILSKLHSLFEDVYLYYENTMTNIYEKKIAASFYFSDVSKEVLLCSNKSKKPTTVKCGEIIITSMDLKTYEDIIDFLSIIGLLDKGEDEPVWMEDIHMFDDAKQFEIIEQNNQIINQANNAITAAMESINKNKRYKSILYTNGKELVDVVFEILTEMLGCDLSGFVDEKNEDFLFVIDGHTFVGEIKGVSHNVKNENVSQLEVHYQRYIDNNPDVADCNISAILIIDHQRNKSISDRELVHEDQIRLAKRNGSLIVETMTLLRLFEKYVGGKMTREECINILKSNTGLLEI